MNTRALARAISSLADGGGPPVDLAQRPPWVIGITGPPGAGKSTVIDALLGVMEGKRVAVLAVDPTSPFTGGALLGDRIRMNNAGPDTFVRSLASRGQTGGLAPALEKIVSLLAANGYEIAIIETAGVGQEQIDVTRLADVTAVVLTPAGGDSVQAEKAGLLEAADVLILNKCDLPQADRAALDIHEATGLPVVRMTARSGEGAADALAAIMNAPRHSRRPPPAGFEIDHIGIAVQSIDESLLFWLRSLGMPLANRETVEGERVHVAMLDAGQSRIELLEAASDDSTIAKFIANRGPGIHHIAIRVPDFERAIATLKDSGARLLGEPRIGAGGHRYGFVHPASTGGVLLELIANEHS
jgi:LAO/AO transport system kinase